jgi:methionyl-tRNA formyltransferase
METDGKTFLAVGTADGAADVLDLRMEGKKRMNIEDFLRGNKL